MYVFQWHFDVPFGKQKDALDVLNKWQQAEEQDQEMPKPRAWRTLVGHIGLSPAHIINEWEWDNIGVFDEMMKVLATGRYKSQSEAIAPFIVPGSQHWEIWRVAAETPGA